MTNFIYCPRSGSRIVAAMPNDFIRVTRWGNGCQHVCGGVLLTWGTSDPGQHWRVNARNMASQIVRSVGGAVWDEQGTICLVVPHSRAVEARDLMCDAALVAGVQDTQDEKDKQNIARLVLAGCLGFRPGSLTETVRQPVGNIPVDWPLPEYWERDEDGNKIARWNPTAVDGGAEPEAPSYCAALLAAGEWGGPGLPSVHVSGASWGVTRDGDGFAVVMRDEQNSEDYAEALAAALTAGRSYESEHVWLSLLMSA